MFIFTSLLAISAILPSAFALPSFALRSSHHHHRDIRTPHQQRNYTVDEELLEPYGNYHARYKSFDCEHKHNTTFWDDCCHPLLKDEKEADLPETCNSKGELFDCQPSPSTSSSPWENSPSSTSSYVMTMTSSSPEDTPTTSHHRGRSTTTRQPRSTTTPSYTTSSITSGGGGGGSGGGWKTGGHATYFLQGGAKGACGKVHADSDLIVAITPHYYEPANSEFISPHCNRKVQIVNLNNGQEITAIVADECPSCDSENCLDMSKGTFEGLNSGDPNSLNEGEFPIKWQFLN